ncbi:MAG: DUF882 domain-containing protein [Kofleriaceae bacterium]
MSRLALALVLIAGTASADEPAKVKKDLARSGKAVTTRARAVAGTRPAKLVNLYNTWTHEWLAVEPGLWPAKPTLDRFLRDHYTSEPTAMEPRLVEIVVAAAQHFQADTVLIVSAFRHEKYNLILRKKGHQVARDSAHTKGNAIDFQLPNVTTKALHAWARAQQIGGVGLYLDSGFIHMDTGKIRYWSGD